MLICPTTVGEDYLDLLAQQDQPTENVAAQQPENMAYDLWTGQTMSMPENTKRELAEMRASLIARLR
eukprot:SAG11_NODE_2884_length_2870_cov_1.601949_2_plen_67_part_00